MRVLGPVEVAGRDPVNRAKSFEAVVYLAMHRNGVDSDKLRWALWPDTPQTKANEGTWNTTGSVARRWLGKAPNGTLLLPRAYHNNGLYRLDEKVSTDYEHFAAEAALAARLDGSAAVGLLHSALERVRGPLFDGAAKWHGSATRATRRCSRPRSSTPPCACASCAWRQARSALPPGPCTGATSSAPTTSGCTGR